MDINNSMLICFGQYVKGTNTYPLAYTKFVRIVTTGDYSWSGSDNRIKSTTLTTFDCLCSLTNNIVTNYLSIGC